MEYQVLVKIPFNAMDDVAARQILQDMVEKNSELLKHSEIKLQETFKDKPPRGIHT